MVAIVIPSRTHKVDLFAPGNTLHSSQIHRRPIVIEVGLETFVPIFIFLFLFLFEYWLKIVTSLNLMLGVPTQAQSTQSVSNLFVLISVGFDGCEEGGVEQLR